MASSLLRCFSAGSITPEKTFPPLLWFARCCGNRRRKSAPQGQLGIAITHIIPLKADIHQRRLHVRLVPQAVVGVLSVAAPAFIRRSLRAAGAETLFVIEAPPLDIGRVTNY
jgi:hypothetical protein